jgi:phage baseplate assembly protein gpV
VSAQAIVGTMRGIARDEASSRWHPALGIVTSAHGGTTEHACTVALRETGLVLPKVPIATGLLGTAALPAVGDLVLVVFAGGDLHAPVVVGRLYDDQVAPPDHQPGELIAFLPGGETDVEKALQVAIRTPGDGTRAIELTLTGSSVEVKALVSDDTIGISVQDTKLELKQTGSSDGKATLQVGDSSITIEQGGDVKIAAKGKLSLTASDVEINGDTTIKVAGQTIDLN